MKRDSRLSGVLHVLLHMAEQSGPQTSETLARAMDTNPVVIRRVMAGLREQGFVHSEKGHGGGWTIVCDLETVTLRNIYEALGRPEILAMGNRTDAPGCLVEQAVNADDRNRARICAAIRRVCKERSWRPDPGVPSRVQLHTEKYLDLLTALQKAYATAVAETPTELRAVMPQDFYEHLDDNIDDVITYRQWMLGAKGEPEPKVSELDKQAARMSLGRAPGIAGRPIPTTKVKKK